MRASACSTSRQLGEVVRHLCDVQRGHRVGDRPVVGVLHPVAQADQARVVLGLELGGDVGAQVALPAAQLSLRARRAAAGVRGLAGSGGFMAGPLSASSAGMRIGGSAQRSRRPGVLNPRGRTRDCEYSRTPAGMRKPQASPAGPANNAKESAMTTLQIYDPFADTAVDSLLRSFFRPVPTERERAIAHPRRRHRKRHDAYVVHAEMPGVQPRKTSRSRSKATRSRSRPK